MCSVAFEKAPPRAPPRKPETAAGIKRLQSREVRAREKRTNAFEAGLSAWLKRYAILQERKVRRRLTSRGLKSGLGFKKARTTLDSLEDELRELYMMFGLQQVEDAGQRWSANLGSRFVMTPQVKARYARTVENKVKLVMDNNEQMVRDSLNRIIVDALSEFPRPTVQEVTRRIATRWHGDPTSKQHAERIEARNRALVERRRRRAEGLPPSKRVTAALANIRDDKIDGLFSPARAAAIARTELGDADTAGALESFVVVGVEKAGWIARPNDGRSGKRKHYEMNNHPPVLVTDLAKGDRSKWFKLPSGKRARRPMDPVLPVGERVNCRCVLTPRR